MTMPPSYRAMRDQFEWRPPDTFNFGRDVVDRWAEHAPDRVAAVAVAAHGAERSASFRELADASDRWAGVFADRGISAGDPVLVVLPRSMDWLECTIGLVKLGAIPVPCITMQRIKDLQYRAGHSGAVAIVASADSAPQAAALDVAKRFVVGADCAGFERLDEPVARHSGDYPATTGDIDDPAIIYYTSGSTGAPKGVVHSSRSLWAWRYSAELWLGLGPSDRIWCSADTGWSKAGTSILFGPWSQGAGVYIADVPFDAQRRVDMIVESGATVYCGAATEFRHLVHADLRPLPSSSLRHVTTAGESLNPAVKRSWEEQTGIPLLEAYGQTESLMVVLNYPDVPTRDGSMGLPAPGLDVGVLTDGSVHSAGSGEMVIGLPCPQLMSGYFRDEERTAAVFLDDGGRRYNRSGDLVDIHVDGYVSYRGRTDELISSAGYRIGPQEVEDVLLEHPAVRECAVVGLPDPERGEVVAAFVVLTDGRTGDGALVAVLQQHVKDTTAPYKYPRRIEFVDDIPKTATGKIQRKLVAARHLQQP